MYSTIDWAIIICVSLIRFSKMNKRIPFYICGLFSLILVTWSICVGQVAVRKVLNGKHNYKNQPIELVSCETANGTVSSCDQIVGGIDWWKGLTILFKNVSAKTISEFNIQLAIEKQGSMRLDLPVVLVPMPLIDSVREVAGQPSFNFRRSAEPGESFRMTVPEIAYSQLKPHLRSGDVTDIDYLLLNIQFIYFDDGTRWDFGVESQIRSGQSTDIAQKKINLLIRGREPIEISNLQVNGKTVNLNEPFIGEGEWLKDFTLIFKNTSDRKIRTITFFLTVLESKPIGPPPGMPFVYGTPRTAPKAENETIRLLFPEESDSVRIDAGLFENLKRIFAEREKLASRTTAELSVADVWFSDDTLWSWGRFYKVINGSLALDGDGSGKRPLPK